MTQKRSKAIRWIENCFILTARERLLIGFILFIFLLGLVARYHHLKKQTSKSYDGPENVTQRYK